MEHVQNIVEMSRRVQLINICLSVDLKSITIIDAVLCAHEHPILLLSFSLLSINLSVVALTKKTILVLGFSQHRKQKYDTRRHSQFLKV